MELSRVSNQGWHMHGGGHEISEHHGTELVGNLCQSNCSKHGGRQRSQILSKLILRKPMCAAQIDPNFWQTATVSGNSSARWWSSGLEGTNLDCTRGKLLGVCARCVPWHPRREQAIASGRARRLH